MTSSTKITDPIPCAALIQGTITLPVNDAKASREPAILSHGALCIDKDRIVAIGEYAALKQRFAPAECYGSEDHLILPGFVNAHDHVRAPSSVELGVPDDLLEVWILDLMRLPDFDPELVSALAHCQMLESGVTTVVNSFYQPTAKRYDETMAAMLTGAQNSGARSVISMSSMDDSIIGSLLGGVRAPVPDSLRKQTDQFLASRNVISMPEYTDLVRSWSVQTDFNRACVMMGPVSVHWCSDAMLEQIWDLSASLGLPMQTHLLESAYQRDTAYERYGRSVVSFMNDAGLLNKRLSCAHCIFTTPADMDLFAASNVSVIHCPGSNLRLKNGVAPVPDMIKHGVNVGLGADSMAFDDDGDILKEMRFAHRLHADTTTGSPLLSKTTLLDMATRNSARAISMGDQIGSLEIGKKADIVVYKSQPRNDGLRTAPSIDALFGSDTSYGVDQVFVDGELVVQNGQHVKINREQLHTELIQVAAKKRRDSKLLDDFIRALTPFIRQHLSKGR